jgi:hypothetical protein
MSWSLAQLFSVAIENQDFVLELFLAIFMAVWALRLIWFFNDWFQKIGRSILVVVWTVLILVGSSLVLILEGLLWLVLGWVDWLVLWWVDWLVL